jgi:hypothetical protein
MDAADARTIQATYEDLATVVPLKVYLSALKYLQTLRGATKPGTTHWIQK